MLMIKNLPRNLGSTDHRDKGKGYIMAILCKPDEPPDMPSRICPSSGRPIDLVYLARQTMGDRSVESQMLWLFARQARLCINQLCSNPRAGRRRERIRLVHTLKCSATTVGAFAVSRAAESLEQHPLDGKLSEALARAVVDVENFISGLSRSA